jgi:hypothetical protein
LTLPGISWIEAQTAAMEVGGIFEILDIPEVARPSPGGHDFAVQAHDNPVGN